MENEVTMVSQPTMLEAINKSEIDVQIATAHQFPRDVRKALEKVKSLAMMDRETAFGCFYQLERKGADGMKTVIEGLSVRMAEIIASCWGNIRVQARIIGNDGRMITAQGVCHDLETNTAVSVEVKRSICGKHGTFSQDMQVVTGNAAAAIAFRNAVLKVIPSVVIKKVVDEVHQMAMGQITDIKREWEQIRSWYFMKGVNELQLIEYLGIHNRDEATKEHILHLQGLANAIHEGTTTVEETFIAPRQKQAQAERAMKMAEEARKKAEQAQHKGGEQA